MATINLLSFSINHNLERMIKMPTKKSNLWIGVFILYTILVLISLIVTRVILTSELTGNFIARLLLISLVLALLPCIAGYFGKRIFFIVYTISILLGIIYMFYIVIADRSPGWGDLASMIGFIFIIGFGTAIALVAEVVKAIITNSHKNS
jgi:hypothetical protein